MVVLEDLEHARARGAKIYAELLGYGVSSDATHVSDPDPTGQSPARALEMAFADAAIAPDEVGYINAHGTSTPVGDVAELGAVRTVFGERDERVPHISSTKSLSGHSLGAAGVQEAIYSLLMLQGGFAAASANIDTLDPAAEGLPVLRQRLEQPLNTVMSNSFGFGGTNASLVFARFDG
jgi:3-oxoacyl-[acyl-carrier-protein] synthase-1